MNEFRPSMDEARVSVAPVLWVRGLTKVYHSTRVPVHALRGVDLSVADGDFVAVMGESGSGKSTLLHIIGALLAPTEGEVRIKDRDLSKLSDSERTELRRREIGFVFQRFNLMPTLTVEGNLKLAERIYGNGRPIASDFRGELLDVLGISGKVSHRPAELSGGEQQRVAIARALLHRPAILLADEPTGNLDSRSSEIVLTTLERMNETLGQTILMITHSATAAASASRRVEMQDGRIVRDDARNGGGGT